MTTTIYSLNEIENISWSNEHNLLPEETIAIINLISEQVGAPSYVRTPLFPNNNNNNDRPIGFKKKKKNVEEIHPDDWEAIRFFQKTEIIKKEGIELEIDGIRLLINKLTEKTYDKILEKLMSTLDDINKNGNYNDESINKIGYAIFNMATSNKFNSNVYARLCSKLKFRYEFMTNIIMTNITEFMKLFDNMEFISPEENYDKFCEMNITNDKRRSMSLFLINLYKNDVITLDFVYQNINNVQNMIMINTTNSEKKSEIDELSENLYILLTNIPFLVLIKHNDWSKINNNLLEFTNLNNKIHTGLSSKSKFKHMDIMDKLK